MELDEPFNTKEFDMDIITILVVVLIVILIYRIL
jgi:hypothetical protein